MLLQLRARGERAVALDNLYTGFRQAVRDTPLVVGDVGDRELVARVLREHDVDTVMHFAANTIVPESVSDPLKYYGNNTCATRNLLEACMRQGVRAAGVFLDRGGVWHSRRRRRRRGHGARANQSLRHLQADVGVDPARSRGRQRLCAT